MEKTSPTDFVQSDEEQPAKTHKGPKGVSYDNAKHSWRAHIKQGDRYTTKSSSKTDKQSISSLPKGVYYNSNNHSKAKADNTTIGDEQGLYFDVKV